jgi:hypothetical protein
MNQWAYIQSRYLEVLEEVDRVTVKQTPDTAFVDGSSSSGNLV